MNLGSSYCFICFFPCLLYGLQIKLYMHNINPSVVSHEYIYRRLYHKFAC